MRNKNSTPWELVMADVLTVSFVEIEDENFINNR